MSSAVTKDAHWWVKLEIDLDHRLTWSVVQELSYVLNYLSDQERLPTVFMPVSPPPYRDWPLPAPACTASINSDTDHAAHVATDGHLGLASKAAADRTIVTDRLSDCSHLATMAYEGAEVAPRARGSV